MSIFGGDDGRKVDGRGGELGRPMSLVSMAVNWLISAWTKEKIRKQKGADHGVSLKVWRCVGEAGSCCFGECA